MKRLPLLLLVILPALAWARSDSLVSELSSDHVDISARYTGDQITLFGALSTGGQIIVKLRSPNQPVSLDGKGKVGPFWLSQERYQVSGVPGLYYLLSSAPIDELLPVAERRRFGLDLIDALADMHLDPSPPEAEGDALKAAVLRLKEARHDYVLNTDAVEILGQRLYSTLIQLPAQLPLGKYRVDIYLVRNNRVTASEHQHIQVEQVRLEHWVSAVAVRYPWVFGVVFTSSMMLLGLVLGMLLDRGKKA
jgi:uncharacterized protein (TIGR02186 family)